MIPSRLWIEVKGSYYFFLFDLAFFPFAVEDFVFLAGVDLPTTAVLVAALVVFFATVFGAEAVDFPALMVVVFGAEAAVVLAPALGDFPVFDFELAFADFVAGDFFTAAVDAAFAVPFLAVAAVFAVLVVFAVLAVLVVLAALAAFAVLVVLAAAAFLALVPATFLEPFGRPRLRGGRTGISAAMALRSGVSSATPGDGGNFDPVLLPSIRASYQY